MPHSERVRLGGIALAEAFPPSYSSALRKALEDYPAPLDKKQEWVARLSKGRTAPVETKGGWHILGFLSRSREADSGDECVDRTLPDGVDAVQTTMFFATPSLTLIVANFVLANQAGDLSEILRSDSHSFAGARAVGPGQFGPVRQRIPWLRRVQRSGSRSAWHLPEDPKRLACESLIRTYETPCSTWLASRFPGRFSAENVEDRPTVRVLLTKESVPFQNTAGWLAPVGLSSGGNVWRSALRVTNLPDTGEFDWFFKRGGPRQFIATAARKQGMGRNTLASSESSLVAIWAMTCLLSLYADGLARLRDAGRRHRVSRTVRQGRELDEYLIGDGLDASTVMSDLGRFPESLITPWGLPTYIGRSGGDLVTSLREEWGAQANRLRRDTAVTTGNIRASAELRQAIANTRLQRVMICLTILAVIIAVISIIVALHTAA
jgi:hypothetical protein